MPLDYATPEKPQERKGGKLKALAIVFGAWAALVVIAFAVLGGILLLAVWAGV
ncbi:MAG TPA: hypothetical protein VH370_22930 [Humisphaera sp.]|nr:hypothetical protein [Humisphaera sp.]